MKAELWYGTPDGTILTDRFEGDHITAQIYGDGRGRVSGVNLKDDQGPIISSTYSDAVKAVIRPA